MQVTSVYLILLLLLLCVANGYVIDYNSSRSLWSSEATSYLFNYKEISYGSFKLVKRNNDTVMRVKYPKDSYAGGSVKGGCGFKASPKNTFPLVNVFLEYKVFFDPKFDFVRGGKLPGLYGGKSSSGGTHLDNGFSARIMWRTNGTGEFYLYVPDAQDPRYSQVARRRGVFGDSLGFGNFTFSKGKWNSVKMYLELNNVDQYNGKLKLWFNDKLSVEFDKMNFRTIESVSIKGIFFDTFFGGDSKDYQSSLDTYADFKDFKLSTYTVVKSVSASSCSNNMPNLLLLLFAVLVNWFIIV